MPAPLTVHPQEVTITAGDHSLSFDPTIGTLRSLLFGAEDRGLSPLHRAAWADDPTLDGDPDLLPVERSLSGDFFCAPFGVSDVETAPAHGWTANSAWSVSHQADGEVCLSLDRTVLGARIRKRLRLTSDAPLLYQTHWIDGGDGGLPVAHHPMVRLTGTGRLSTSPKQTALTPAAPLEPGRHRLAYPAEQADLTRFPATAGGTVDLTRLPIADRHEDFVTLIEAPGASLGWTAVVRDAEDDIVFFLKDPSVLPVTMLWHSNGGRDYRPWNGTHTGVIGIEDGCAAGADGHAAALTDNPINRHGVPTALPLSHARRHRIDHVIGAIARPVGWSTVTDIVRSHDHLTLTDVGGGTVTLPFEPSFFIERT